MRGLAKEFLGRIERQDFLKAEALIAGAWRRTSERTIVVDPATEETIAEAASCTLQDVAEAVDAAESAARDWADLLPLERGKIIRDWAALMREHARDLAVLITCEQGKPIDEAEYEIVYAAGFLDWFAGEGERAYGVTPPSHKPNSLLQVRQQPLGVVATITPWNFPSAMITRKAGAALAAGCTVISKPAVETPLSGFALARLAQQAGMPPGVFQVISGDPASISAGLLDDTRVRGMSFTGSTSIGTLLAQRAARSVKRVSLELGGLAPVIVFDDVSVGRTIEHLMSAKFATSGQDCLAANRIYVQRGVYDEVVERLTGEIGRLRVGHGLAKGTDVGPMTKRSVVGKCNEQIADAVRKGAALLVGGKDTGLGRNFVQPALLADVTDDMHVCQEETFGPVAAVLPFDFEDEVLSRANASEMGLSGYVFTNDLGRALRTSDRLECGMVGVNTASFTGPPVPFGGWKQSGLGREGAQQGLLEFMETKYVCFGSLQK
jgi:aspartate-semialdehyde dehydrogenase